MTPEQKAREWAEKEKKYPKRPYFLDMGTVVYNSRQEVLQELAIRAYLSGHRESLTTLMDELPEEEKYIAKDIVAGASRDGHNACLKKIKSLIQDKITNDTNQTPPQGHI